MTETVTKFATGERVPDWLITIEPMSPQSHKENFRFAIDVDVIETDEVFVVVPRTFGSGHSIIDMSGTSGCKLFAPGKPTRVVVSTNDFFAEGVGVLVQIGAATPPPSPAVDNAYVEAATDPHRSFWARLKYIFKGER